MKVLSAFLLVFGVVGASVAAAREPSKAATSELPAALQMVGVSQDSVVSRAAAHQVRGQLFLGESFDFNQIKTFDVTGAVTKGTTTLLEGVTGDYQYSLTEVAASPALPAGVTKTITLLVDGQFAGLGGGIGVNNDTTDATNFGSLNFVVGGKFLNETLEFQGGSFNQMFSQSFGILLAPPGGG